MFLRLKIFILVLIAGAGTLLARSKPEPLVCHYTMDTGDSLSMILFNGGIGSGETAFHLYGEGGWVEINIKANPSISDWNKIPVGTKIVVYFPADVKECPSKLPKPQTTEAPPAQPEPSPLIPEKTVDASPGSQEAKKEDEDVLKELEDQLKKLTSSSVSLRYGRSTEGSGYILLPRVATWSVVYESRFEAFRKLRVYFDFIPRVTETWHQHQFYMESSRLQLGRAFVWDLWSWAEFDVAPKIGYWRYASHMPLKEDGIVAVELGFNRQLNLGFDAGVSRRWGVLTGRVWHGRDATLAFMRGDKDTAGGQAYRTGLEGSVSGPNISFGDFEATTVFTLFGMDESVKISHGKPLSLLSTIRDTTTNQDLNSVDQTKAVSYDIIYVGLGLGLSW